MAIVEGVESEGGAASAPPPSARPATVVAALGRLLPGLAAVGALTAGATALGRVVPVVGAPVIAICGGIVLSLVRRPSARTKPGIAFAAKRVLQGSVVLLGLGLSLHQVVSAGVQSLPVLVGTLLAALGMAAVVGRLLGLSPDLRTLVGVGTAICGASAIAATDAVIDADDADVSYAVATIFAFNVAAVLLYPFLGHAMGFSQRSFGLWAGTAINDVSSVVAASTIYGHAAASYGVVVKLTRTLAIVPIALVLAASRARRRVPSAGERRGHVPLRRVLPLFVVAFVAAVAANSAGLVPAGWHRGLGDVSAWMITAALGAVGLSTDVSRIRRTGLRPLGLGAILWLTVGLASLGLQALTGTL